MKPETYTRPTETKTDNREGWLMSAAEHLWGRVITAGGERPKTCRVSCGWPSKSALRTASSHSRRIGEAWHSSASEDGAREVFISPALADEVSVMDVLLHELIHAALPADAGHGPAFQKIMRAVGLTGKPTATVAGDELVEELRIIAHELGRYPHAALDAPLRGRKPGRMVKGSCPDCGTILYGSRAAWDNALPVCSVCSTTYVVDPSPEQAAAWGLTPAVDAEALENVATMVELRTKDGRFTLSSTKRDGQDGSWLVTDLQAVATDVREVELGGEVVEVTAWESRWTYRRDRADAVAFISALRSGEVEWDDLYTPEAEDDEDETFDELDDLDLGDPADLELEPGEGDEYLADDEVEELDNPEDDVEDVEAYERTMALREESGRRKSEQIAASGGEGALD